MAAQGSAPVKHWPGSERSQEGRRRGFFQLDRPPVQRDDLAHDGQSQAAAAPVRAGHGRSGRTRARARPPGCRAVVRDFSAPAPSGRRATRPTAGRRVADRVVDEIREQDPQASSARTAHPRASSETEALPLGERPALRRRPRPRPGRTRSRAARRPDRGAPWAAAAAPGASRASRPRSSRAMAQPRAGSVGGALRSWICSLERGERRAQLVRGIGGEAALQPERVAKPCEQVVERLHQRRTSAGSPQRGQRVERGRAAAAPARRRAFAAARGAADDEPHQQREQRQHRQHRHEDAQRGPAARSVRSAVGCATWMVRGPRTGREDPPAPGRRARRSRSPPSVWRGSGSATRDELERSIPHRVPRSAPARGARDRSCGLQPARSSAACSRTDSATCRSSSSSSSPTSPRPRKVASRQRARDQQRTDQRDDRRRGSSQRGHSRREHVADAAHGADHVVAELAAQVVDVHLDGVAADFLVPAVEAAPRAARATAPRPAVRPAPRAGRTRRATARPARRRYRTSCVAGSTRTRPSSISGSARPDARRSSARTRAEQFVEVERLDEIVVGAGVEACDAVGTVSRAVSTSTGSRVAPRARRPRAPRGRPRAAGRGRAAPAP